MRALVALKWSRSLNKSFVATRTLENSCTSVINRTIECEKNRCFSVAVVNNTFVEQKWSGNCCAGITRNFSTTNTIAAKSKDKEKKKKGGKPQHIDQNELAQVVNVDQLTGQLDKAVTELKNNFVKHLTLRSATGSIEQVPVTFDGQEYLLQELVQIARKPKTVVLNVTTFPQAIPQILEALSKSGMNLNPQQDGTTIFVPIPKVTKEHRENLSKNAKALYIKCRDNIKEIRNKEIRNLKKKPSLSEDDGRRIQAQLEALSDQYINNAEKILDTKQKELLGSSSG